MKKKRKKDQGKEERKRNKEKKKERREVLAQREKKDKKSGGEHMWSDHGPHTLPNIYENAYNLVFIILETHKTCFQFYHSNSFFFFFEV